MKVGVPIPLDQYKNLLILDDVFKENLLYPLGDDHVTLPIWIAIYLPLFILLFVILPQQQLIRRTMILKLIRKKKGEKTMSNETIKKYVGALCSISSGAYASVVTGKIITVTDNWIEVETKKGIELVNAEFVQNIKILTK